MKKTRIGARPAALAIAVAFAFASPQPSHAAPSPLTVLSTSTNEAGTQLTVRGINFTAVRNLRVLIGGSIVPLTLLSLNQTSLVALLPLGLVPGTYWAQVVSGTGGDTEEFWFTLGEQGAMGPAGPAGPVGPQGPAGPMGATGLVGPAGPIGPIGATGPAGPVGATGPQGAPGPTGIPGPVGATGPQGAPGPTGIPGPIGATGPQGIPGPIGATGPQGVPGPVGATGAQGPIGATGAQGPQGATGAAGPQGATGPAGPQGPAGTMTVAPISSPVAVIAPSPTLWVFVGVTLPLIPVAGPTTRLTGTATALLATTGAVNVPVDLHLCTQLGAAALVPFDINLPTAEIGPTRSSYSAIATRTGLAAGTYRVGMCVRALAALGDNDWVQGWIMVH